MAAAPYSFSKKFRFTGLVELAYRDYSVSSTYYGSKSESESTSFEQRYKLGIQGYVYHPKLVTFLTSVTFRKEKTGRESDDVLDVKDINYDFSAFFLATTPVSLDVYGSRTDSTLEGLGNAPYNITSNFYGARLYFRNRKYPSVRLEYNHWDYIIEREKGFRVMNFEEGEGLIVEKKRVKEKTAIDRFSIDMNGFLRAANTRYNLTADLSDYTSPSRNYKGKNLTATTYTVISKENMLSTSIHYSDIDIVNLTRAAANVTLFPIGKLRHSYEYEYITSETERVNTDSHETEREKTDSHTFSSHLRYKFSRLIFGTAQLRYRFGNRNGVREDSYDINIGLNYGRPVKDFDFTSYYKFNLSNEERHGEFRLMANSLGIGLSTRKFRWGKIYSNYDISLREFDFSSSLSSSSSSSFSFFKESEDSEMASEKAHSLEHKIRVGINGKGPGRSYWNIEAEARIFDSQLNDHGSGFWLGEDQWADKIRHYTLSGDIGYPMGRRGVATARAGYTTGSTNSESVEKYYYEGRLNYRILTNLNLLAWWREEWRNKGWWAGSPISDINIREFGWKTREYRMELYYLIHRVKLSLEYNAYRLEEGPSSSEYKRLYVKMSRPFSL